MTGNKLLPAKLTLIIIFISIVTMLSAVISSLSLKESFHLDLPPISQIVTTPSSTSIPLPTLTPKPATTVTPGTTPSPISSTPAPTPVPSDTSDWKTYKSSDYKLEFKYPLNTIVSNRESDKFPTPYQQLIRLDFSRSFFEGSTIRNGYMNVVLCNGDNNICFTTIPKNTNIFEEEIPTPIDINGTILYKFLLSSTDNITYIIMYRTVYQGKVYEINFSIQRDEDTSLGIYGENETRIFNVFDKIISTLNFQKSENASNQITNLKTYKDTKYGFEFKYPADFIICNAKDESCNFEFRCDIYPNFWNQNETNEPTELIKIGAPSYTFLSPNLKNINVSTPACGTIYVEVLKNTTEKECKTDFDQKETTTNGVTFYYTSDKSKQGDCDMQGCNGWTIYNAYNKNTCYKISTNTYYSSRYRKGVPFVENGKLTMIESAPDNIFSTIYDQIISTFKFINK